jgi:outer membrane immunogenic protein
MFEKSQQHRRTTMKKTILSIAILLSGTALSHAADQYRPAAPIPYTEPFTWSGLYVGAVGGYGQSSSQGLDMKSGTAGGTVGFNAQWESLVFGLEGDVSWLGLKQSIGPIVAETNHLITVRGRIGYAFDRLLIYGTAGIASVENQLSVGGLSDRRSHDGFVYGAGIEYGITNAWSAKVEYLRLALQSANYFEKDLGVGVPSGSVDIDMVRAGVSYRFR